MIFLSFKDSPKSHECSGSLTLNTQVKLSCRSWLYIFEINPLSVASGSFYLSRREGGTGWDPVVGVVSCSIGGRQLWAEAAKEGYQEGSG